MNSQNYPIIISNRVAELEKTNVEGVYRVSLWSASGFGDDETTYRTLYEELLKGYRHDCIKIEGMEDTAFGLLPPPESLNPAYVEVDEQMNPIPVSEKGLEAVRLVEHLIGNGIQNRDDLLRQIIDAAWDEKPALKVALFMRLREHFAEAEGLKIEEIPASLFKLLPWNLFNEYLKRLNGLIQHNNQETYSLPNLKYYFVFISRGLAYRLTTLVEKLEKQEEFDSVLYDASGFIDELWHAKLERFPLAIRKRLIRALDNLGNKFLSKKLTPELKPEQTVETSIAICQANLLISKLKELNPDGLSLLDHLGNVLRAALAADKGSFFNEKPQYAKLVCGEIQETIEFISKEPHILTDLLDDTSSKDAFDGLLNTADLYRFHAQVLSRLRGNWADALIALDKGEPCYKKAEECIPSVPKPRTKILFYHRYARALILRGEIYARQGQGKIELVKGSLKEALNQLDQLSEEDCDAKGLYAHYALKAEALMAMVKGCGEDENLESRIEELLKKAIEISPKDALAYEMLYEYYFKVKRDIRETLNWINYWIDCWRKQGKLKRSIEWLQYRAARDCAHAAIENPSLRSEAIKSYVQVLKDQPSNLDAISDLIEILKELSEKELKGAFGNLDEILEKGEELSCPAIVRILFFADSSAPPEYVGSATQALLVLVKGPERLFAEAKNQLAKIPSKHLIFIIENISKWYFNQGRTNPLKTELDIAERLVDVYLDIEGDETVFLTRKLDIALERRDFKTAERILPRLERVSPGDPIVALKSGMLRIKQGDLQSAKDILEKSVSNKTEQVHPALLDRLAQVALLGNDFSRAEALYKKILSANEFDPIARFGLGRVYFEWGQEHWTEAFAEWLQALRLRTMDPSLRNVLLAKFTARSIVSLCQQRPSDSQIENTDIAKGILSALEQAIRSECVEVSSLLVNNLAALGIVNKGVVTTVREALSDVREVVLARRVAQYLMTRTIYLTLGVERDGLRGEIATCIEQCLDKKVLPEYLAGAKGSYGRALLRLAMLSSEIDVSKALNQYQILKFQSSLNAPLRKLYDHICTSGEYSPDYYREAYKLFKEIGNLRLENWVWFTKGLVRGVTLNIWNDIERKGQGLKTILSTFPLTISLWPLKSILHLQNGTQQIGGWVDLDGLNVFESEFKGNSWQISGLEVQREIQHAPVSFDISLFGGAGIFFRQKENGGSERCYVKTRSGPDYASEENLEAERIFALTR